MGEDQQDALKLRISKKAYIFDVRKRFAASRSFAVRKKPETPAEDIKERLKEIMEKRRQPLSKPQGEKGPAKPGGMSVLKIAVAAVAVAALLLALLAAFLPPGGAGAVANPAGIGPFLGSFGFSVGEARVLTVESADAVRRTGYLLLSYSASNLSSLNFSATLYSSKPATQVFLLDYPRDSGNSYPAFRRYLIDDLGRLGISANDIDLDRLPTLPSGALLVVPTGYFPKELLGIGSTFDYKGLLRRGVSIIYIGLPFDNQAMGRDGLTVPVSYNEIEFDRKARPKSTDGFGLFNPQYAAVPGRGGGNELAAGQQLYGTVSVVRDGPGSLLMLPQSLDSGWRERDVSGSWSEKGELAAQDIARMINEERWLSPLAWANATGQGYTAGDKALSLFTSPFSYDSAYVKLAADAVDIGGVQQRILDAIRLDKAQEGTMVPSEPQTVPYYLSGQGTRLNVALHENSSVLVKLYVEMYKDGKLLQRTDLEPGMTNPMTEKSVDIQVDAEPGDYVVTVSDASGKVYAACQLTVTDLDIQVNESNWAKGRFSFYLSSAGQSVEPRSLAISLDGKNEMLYSPSSLRIENGVTVVDYSYPEKIASGPHHFTFTTGPYSKGMDIDYNRTPPFWENPIFLVLGILAAGVFGIGVALRRPEALKYGLDIPDFPPISSITIPVKRETVLDIFDSVNAGYSWQMMPLRPDEVKNGFRKLTYNGKPILIGDFNLDRLLSKLVSEGLVKEEIGYFGLARWEKESRHTVHYLATYRILRNVFVNNAVKFSKLDAMADCDMKAIAGKEEIYLQIAEEPLERAVHRALATAKKGTTIMVFKTPEGRDAFRSSLTSTSKLAVGLKMEVDGGRIMLLTAKNEISAYLKGIVK